ncbi:hypothetical protein S225a_07000 [Candidatus Brocadiaceae bacterium S225]|nr:hypothetical protein S225a_07000 [Candidatus Brocadiaceae bacterium S225]
MSSVLFFISQYKKYNTQDRKASHVNTIFKQITSSEIAKVPVLISAKNQLQANIEARHPAVII